MLRISDKQINSFVREMIRPQFTENLVIAGGFAAALYYGRLQSVADRVKYFNEEWKSDNIRNHYSDIDFWILKDSMPFSISELEEINKHKHVYLAPTTEMIPFSKGSPVHHITSSLGPILATVSPMSLTMNLNSEKVSNTYQLVIKDTYSDVESVINAFDLNICKVAWYKDILYVHDDCAAAFFDKSIKKYSDFTGLNFQTITTSIRALKYSKRYPDMQIESETLEEIIEAFDLALSYLNGHAAEPKDFFDAILSTTNILKNVLIYASNNLSNALSLDSATKSQKPYITKSCESLINQMPDLLSQKTIKKDMLVFMINDHPYAKKLLNKYFYS